MVTWPLAPCLGVGCHRDGSKTRRPDAPSTHLENALRAQGCPVMVDGSEGGVLHDAELFKSICRAL
eukprot:scaffold284257_cov30-Tisochrysis_lutea.AAC.2